jgi:hypothetical protein
MLVGHMYGTPTPPRERNASIPVEWEALCLRMMEKSREARFQSVTELAHALEDLRGHAAAYEQFRAQRAGSGHSGHTVVAGGEERPTLHVALAHEPPAPIVQSFDPRRACHALATDARHAAFPRTLMTRPSGRWYEVGEVCRTSGVAQPAALPPEDGLWVAWIEHPYPDPSLAAVVFLSLRTGWSNVVLSQRVR